MSDYPSFAEVRAVRQWPIAGHTDALALVDYLRSIWHWPEYVQLKRGRRQLWPTHRCWKLQLHTGGWSGNEEIMGALMQNRMFWSMYWRRTNVGGHFYFDIWRVKESL